MIIEERSTIATRHVEEQVSSTGRVDAEALLDRPLELHFRM